MHWKRLLHHLLTSHHPNLLSSRTAVRRLVHKFWGIQRSRYHPKCDLLPNWPVGTLYPPTFITWSLFSALPCSVGLALVSYPIHRGLICPPSTRPPASSWWRRWSPCYTREMVAARLGGGYCHQLCGPGHSPRPGHGCPRCLVTHHHQPGHPALATPIISIIIITTKT